MGKALGKAGLVLLLGAIVVILLGRVLAQTAPTQLPALRDVRYRRHAVVRHQGDALAAREGLEQCADGDLRAQLCRRGVHGMTVVFWCEVPGATLCPGMYTTISGLEKTSFIRPCEQWRACR